MLAAAISGATVGGLLLWIIVEMRKRHALERADDERRVLAAEKQVALYARASTATDCTFHVEWVRYLLDAHPDRTTANRLADRYVDGMHPDDLPDAANPERGRGTDATPLPTIDRLARHDARNTGPVGPVLPSVANLRGDTPGDEGSRS